MSRLLTILFLLGYLASCGKKPPVADIVQPANASIFNKWAAVNPATALHGITELDFSGFTMNEEYVDQNCDGAFGNSGDVNGVSQGNLEFTGSTDDGVLQFGHLKYVGASESFCREMSKEGYTFKISGNSLHLCMINYAFCADYIKS